MEADIYKYIVTIICLLKGFHLKASSYLKVVLFYASYPNTLYFSYMANTQFMGSLGQITGEAKQCNAVLWLFSH